MSFLQNGKKIILRAQSLLLLAAMFLLSTTAWAWPPIFGPEFTFTNRELEAAATTVTSAVTSANKKALELWNDIITKICQASQDCIVEKTSDKHGKAYKITYNDGFWYQVSLDTGVLEVQTMPRTREQFAAIRERISKDVFDVAKSIGLKPHERLGGGHLNIGLESAFADDAKLFRNYFVDQANHPELHLGVLGRHKGNAPTLSDLGEGPQQALKKVIDEFDHNPTDYYALSRRIEREVYTKNPYQWDPKYYQNHRLEAVSKSTPAELQRIEVRSLRPQISVEEFLLECELYEKRLEYLKKLSKPLPLQIPPSADLSPGEIKSRFYNFLREMGESPAHYEPLLVGKIKEAAPINSSIPYNEIYQNSLETREHYQRVSDIEKNISPEQIKKFREAAYKQANGERNLHHVPRVLREGEHAFLVRAVNQRARALKAFFEDLNSGNSEVLKQNIIPNDIFNRFLVKSETSMEKITKVPWDQTGFYYGPDIVRHSDGKFYVLEDNTGYLGGMADAVEARRDLLKFLPKYQEVFKDSEGVPYAKILAETLGALKKNPDEAMVLLILDDEVRYNAHLIRQLEKYGVYTVTSKGLNGRAINASSGEVILHFAEKENRAPIKVGAIAIRSFSQSGFQKLFPNTYHAFSEGKVAVMGYPFTGFDILSDKEFSRYGEDLVRFYLKEEPLIHYIPTISFRGVGENNTTIFKQAEFDTVFSHIEKYVIKETNSAQGTGVYIGSKIGAGAIDDLKRKIKANPGVYVAQEYIPLSTVGDQIVDMRIFSTVTKSGVKTSDQFWGRALSVHGDGRVNVSQKGQVIPVFVDGRDTVRPGEVSIPDDPLQLNVRKESSQVKTYCPGFFSRLGKFFF